ncbi:hypothetical protein ONZ45_g6084 [Pleurotus djamor]|nr:hypothetical protein ONZ45_g6084 [Pleurotus djamor]
MLHKISLLRGQEIQSSLRHNGRANGHAIVSPPPPPPPTFTFSQPPTTSPASRSAPVQAAASPDQNLALAYLSERRGKGMSDVEVDGLISLLQQNSSTPKAEPFRFTTPLKSQSPAPPSTSLPSLNATTPRRTLTRNPNGVYRWEGGGSAKRSRNRYHSPAFGPPRTTPDRLKLSNPPSETPPVPRMDTKRRRVGEDAASSSTTPSGSATRGHPVHMKTPSPPPRASAPGPSPTRAAQAYPFPAFQGPLSPSPTTNGATNGSASQTQDKTSAATTTPTRLRIPQKPTTPVIPSPLRQTWSQQGDGSPPQAGPSQSQPQRQTMAANFMSELIKEVTPPTRPDVSNPYQTASPVKLPSRPKSSRPRATGKPTAVNGKAAREAASKGEDGSSSKQKPLSDYSPQAIIEATLPKGSKRSRPTSSNTNSSSEDNAEIDERSNKRTKDSVSNEPLVQVAIPSIPIVPMQDPLKLPIPQDAKKDAPAAGNKVVFGAPKASSIPKEPSKLRFSYQPGNSPEGTPASKNDVPPTPKLAPAQIPLFAPKQPPSFSADSSKSNAASSSLGLGLPSSLAGRSSAAVTNQSKPPTPGGAKGAALNVPTADLPTFSFTFGSKSFVNGDSASKRLALAVPKSELPTFSFTFGKTPDAPSKSSTSAVPSTSTGGFNWSAAGMKPPTAKGDTWTLHQPQPRLRKVLIGLQLE